MLQYFAADFFSPIIIDGHMEKNNELSIYVATDHEAVNEDLVMKFYKWDSPKPVHSFSFRVHVVSKL